MAQSNLAVEFDFSFPAKPARLSDDEKAAYKKRIKSLLIEKNAVLIAHYYTNPEIQALAEETGGCVADSLEMARFGNVFHLHRKLALRLQTRKPYYLD